MEFSVVFESITLIGLMILIGVILANFTPINDHTKKLYTMIIVNVAMPCIILSSIFKVEINQEILKNILIVFIFSLLINILGIAIGWFGASFSKKYKPYRSEIALLSGLGNTGFIGIPLCATILGPEGALYAAIFDAGVDLVIWTVGVMILQKSKSFSFSTLKTMVNIPTIAIILGLCFAFVNFRPPELFVNLSSHLAALASPLAMFYIGLLIRSIKKEQFIESRDKVGFPTIIKLVGLPLIVFVLLQVVDMDLTISQTILIQAMMPVLTLASILFTKYGANDKFGAITTVTSTIISLISIPFLIFLLTEL